MEPKIRKCPLCNHTESIPLCVQEFSNHFPHEIVCCDRCGFVFVRNTPSQKYYNNYYRSMSKYEEERDHELHKKYVRIIKSKVGKSSRILDIGCSTGHLLYLLRKSGYTNLFGIDPSPKCKEIALSKFKIVIESADLFLFNSNKKYDFIILAAMLEHLREVRKAISKANSLLSEGGYVFISVPDAGNFYLNLEEPFGEFSVEHINFFSVSSLYQLMLNFTCVYMKSDKKVIYSVWKKGSELRTSIKRYIGASNHKLAKLKKVIDQAPLKLIVWGAGSLTQRLLRTTDLSRKVFKFVDRNINLIGKKLDGIEIISPDELQSYDEPILVSTFRFKDEIIRYIKSKKLNNQIFSF